MTLTAPKHIRGRMRCGTPVDLVSERLEWMTIQRKSGATLADLSHAIGISISSVQRILTAGRVRYRRPIKNGMSRFYACGVKVGAISPAIEAMPVEVQERLLDDAARSGKTASAILADVYTSARAEARGGANV